jgi:type IV pilus assembly protein PilC
MAKFADVCIQNNPDCAAQQSKRCKSNVKLAKLTPGELSAFCDQIAMILEAGIPIAEGVCLMTAETSNPRFDKILAELSVRLELGHPLHDAMRQTGAFPQYTADMAEIGMLSGRLESVMKALAVYHRREQLIADGIKNAVTYPLTMIAMMTLVILVLIIQVLPVFAGVFVQLGGQMGGLARAMMDFGGRLASSLPFLAVLAALTALFLMITFRSPVWRQRLTVFAAIFAPTKKVSALVATGRFTAALSLMLSSGLDTRPGASPGINPPWTWPENWSTTPPYRPGSGSAAN